MNKNYAVTIDGGYNQQVGEGLPTFIKVTGVKSATRSGGSAQRARPIGWLNPTNYSMVEESWFNARGSVLDEALDKSQPTSLRVGSGLGIAGVPTLRNNVYSALDLNDVIPSSLTQRALVNARNKLKNGSINLGQAFVERGQTAELVATNLSRVANALLALRRRNIKRFFHELRFGTPSRKIVRKVNRTLDKKGLHRTWLEYQYGWKPLLSDIHGAVTALDAQKRDNWNITCKAKVGDRIVKELTLNAGISKHKARLNMFFGSFVRIDAVPSNTALQTAASLGFTNPVALAWELLPFSFLFDWALPLGDYFSSWDATLGWEIKGFSQSNFTKIQIDFTGVSHQSGNHRFSNNWLAGYRKTKLDRGGSLVVPFPAFPRPKDPFGSKEHVANALALLGAAVNWRS